MARVENRMHKISNTKVTVLNGGLQNKSVL